ncbi:DUF1054 family protein [Paucilactobacillus kaifaensis]|uniref:DUF1054 family protein n=1 Tax=Paucilactobacillus kaifaensis TaxID=2559921 RepID=UPI0010F6292D|nr:DUF1054 family protein [Paucilactobacillus kaifaensis]
MFSRVDFDVFLEPTLAGRMEKIRTIIDPQFERLNEFLQPKFEHANVTLYPHIAKHMRRTINPPINTWIAFGPEKRGYKKNPHFEVGLWRDRMFVWLALLGESKANSQNVDRLQHSQVALLNLSDGFYICQDHTDRQIELATAATIDTAIDRYKRVKKDEFLIGQVWHSNDIFFQDNTNNQLKKINAVIGELLPIYQKWL